MFTKHVETLNMCQFYIEDSVSNHLIIEGEQMCDSYCKHCYESSELSVSYIDDGQVSTLLLRICRTCRRFGESNQKCIRKAFLVITTDYEEEKRKLK